MVATQRFLFSPRSLGEDFQFDSYFSDGLKPPTSFLSKLMLLKRPSVVSNNSTRAQGIELKWSDRFPPTKKGGVVYLMCRTCVCVWQSGPHYSHASKGDLISIHSTLVPPFVSTFGAGWLILQTTSPLIYSRSGWEWGNEPWWFWSN